ncbi:Response regulator PleD [Planctomycetes bacterium Pan216]|uniref:Response regulator PleD n=1 Tax=Kolteria novifilia TaxID=2527975 RepID=A0A518B1E1_9BACT|nr:Response regulator PleD [Planctomycetes bacterium Pan216]
MGEGTVRKILVADDNMQNLELIEAYLAEVDGEVVTAIDGDETLVKARELVPDLILLDVMMPKVSGFEVCKQLKADEKTKDIPILMVTSLHESADIERGVEAGTDDFLSKPIHKQILLKRVESLLRVRHLQNQLERTLAYLQEVEDTGRSEEN